MELENGKVYFSNSDEKNWTFVGWISDPRNPGKRKACFSRIEKHDRFISEDDLDDDIEG